MQGRNIIDYLPPYMAEYHQMKAIMNSEQLEINLIKDFIQGILNNNYVITADEYAVSRYEKIMDILPSGSLEDRKITVLSKILSQLPFTMRKLQEIMNNMVGKDNYDIVLHNTEYKLVIRLSQKAYPHIRAINNLLVMVLPANLIYQFVSYYMAHTPMILCSHLSHRQTIRISPYRRV